MARYQENPHRKKMWFGTQHHSEWIDCPLRNADMSPEGWGTEGTYLSGGGFSRQSKDSHRNYIFEWGAASSRGAAETMQAYRDGVYNKYDFDLLYFIDPLTYSRNILPKRWSQPGIVTVQGREIHSPLGRVSAIQTPEQLLGMKVPLTGARVKSQTLSAFNALTHPQPRSVWIPIPQGEILTILAWTRGDSGNNGLYVRPLGGQAQKCGSGALTFSGVPGVLLGTVGEFDFFGARAVIGRGDNWREGATYSWELFDNNSVSYRTTPNGVVTNQFRNPNMVTTDAGLGVTVWENLSKTPHPDESVGGSAGGWSFQSSSEAVTSIEYSGGPEFYPNIPWVKRTLTSELSYAGSLYGSLSSTSRLTEVSPGEDYVVSMWFISSVDHPSVRIVCAFYDAEGETVSGSEYLDYSETTAYEWKELMGAVTAPAGAVYMRNWVGPQYSYTYQAGDFTGGTGYMVTQGPERGVEFFSHSFSPDPDLEPRGTVGETPARLVGKQVAGLSAAYGEIIQSSQWSKSGGVSARLIRTTSNPGNTFARVLNLPVGDQTIVAWRYQDKELTPNHSNFGTIGFGTSSPLDTSEPAPNTPGETLLYCTRDQNQQGTGLLSGHFLDIGQSVWFDLVTVADTPNYTGPPFSGSSPDEGPEWLVGSGNSGCRFVGNPTWVAHSGVNGGQIGYAATLKEVGDWQQ